MFIRMALGILTFLATSHNHIHGQTGSWNILNAKIALDSSWQIGFEGQVRSLSPYNDFNYYEYKTALSYSISERRAITAGLGSYRTFLPGGNFRTPATVKEIRSWLEFTLKNPGRIVNLEHRYRIEQRYTTNGFLNRFRYRLGAIMPLGKNSPYFIGAWEEVFFTNRKPYFLRNRASFVFGKNFDNMIVQAGYLYQFDYKTNAEIGKGYFQISIGVNLNQDTFKTPFMPFIEG